ncbi:MAG TPA: VCBS repeat-containing protein [Acidimicrobiia bacterium]|nr:VCBS repeat-containing protein [Acidimicrobiia bacterium]
MRRRPVLSVAVSLLASAGLSTLPPAPASAAGAMPAWDVTVAGGWFAWGSPAIGDVNGDGSNDVVVGGQDGLLYAYDANGAPLPGWPARATSAMNSTPAIGDVDGDGRNEVIVGTGTLEVAGARGALDIFNGNGSRRCEKLMSTAHGTNNAVYGAPAIGDVTGDGVNDVVFGSWDTTIYVLNGNCGTIATKDNRDSVFSTPALYDVDGTGQLDIFLGGDATENSAVKGDSFNGGIFRRLRYNGTPTLAQVWERRSTEAFQSGAAIGDITGDGVPEVVSGSGMYWCRTRRNCPTAPDSNKVWAFNLATGADVAGWPQRASMNTTFNSAPALGDLDGDGIADVAIGSTSFNPNLANDLDGGAIDTFYSRGFAGVRHKAFVTPNDKQQPGSPVIADVDGKAGNEIVFANTGRVFVLNGALGDGGLDFTGSIPLAHVNAVAIGELGRGQWSVVVAGFLPKDNSGRVDAFTIPTPTAAPWPMLGKNRLHTGADPLEIAPIQCNSGYRLVASDGGVFAFGNAAFYGSTGNIVLNRPIVGGIPTKSNKGYWFVASDGGVFNYGDAKFFGSTGNIRLHQPIVGMAATPSGNGYWLVAADGGIFNYGDAKFFGSTGNIRLNKPIVGMSAAPSGAGYWFVASDGGIFNYGDAKFFGSTGNIVLAQPVVGMRATSDGKGYWFVARDGGIFNYGNAEFCGSTGRRMLNSPIVALS